MKVEVQTIPKTPVGFVTTTGSVIFFSKLNARNGFILQSGGYAVVEIEDYEVSHYFYEGDKVIITL